MLQVRTRGEMDITAVFGTVILGSSPGGCTRICMHYSLPLSVSRVTDTLEKKGFEAYLVGGCVRDLLMGIPPKDWDITTNATPEEIIPLFEKVVYENNFGTVAVVYENEAPDSPVRTIEITTFRSETTYSNNRHPDSISFADSLHIDLLRRDFTMNAIALKILKDIDSLNDISQGHFKGHNVVYKTYVCEVFDFHNGLQDIAQKTIRAVGNPHERFSEDALRMMRAIRFSAQLGFSVSHETMEAIITHKKLLAEISTERIRDEFIKIIRSPHPAIGIGFLVKLGLMEMIIPELLEGIDCEQGGAHRYDVFEHLVQALQHAADKNYSTLIRLAALFHDIGKPRTKRPGKNKPTFYGHEVIGARMTEAIMKRLKFPKKDTEFVVTMVRYHMFFSDTEQITLSAVRRLIQNVGKERIWDLMTIRECDRVGMAKKEAPYRLRKFHAMIEEALRDPISVKQLAIDGTMLMQELHVKPGPRLGYLLAILLEEVLENPEKNTEDFLVSRATELNAYSDSELLDLSKQAKNTAELAEQEKIHELHAKHGVAPKNT
jgi:tRNA nucleotidyltransferase (CCA-adding enzyme)